MFACLGWKNSHIFSWAGEDVRINERFFIGGSTFRGFEDAGIGPRDISTTDALGGNSFYKGTVEMTFPLGTPEELGFKGAVFSDFGSLFDTDDSGSNVFDEDALRASAGLGLAWQSPLGPIRIDYAHPFMKESQDKTESISFNFGTSF